MATRADLTFLKKMEAEAKCLAGGLDSRDHWAKPFYSGVRVFRPGVPRVFLGLNGKGNRYSFQYDREQGNERHIWSGTAKLHNAYLDERWGDVPSEPMLKGKAHLQIAVQQVFEAMYGDDYKRVLRRTPCFNLIPVSSNGTKDKKLDKIWDDGVRWCIELLCYLRPKSIILFGNSRSKTSKSVWGALEQCLDIDEYYPEVDIIQTFKIYRGVTHKHVGAVPVIGLPHLSMMRGKNLDRLCRKLRSLGPFE